MPHIQVLPKQLADMIAAGEVIERPASVVKELVENAIDAGATEITVEIRHGGTTYIRVTDNGKGIPKEEVATAFLRHATSKLRSAQDLDHIGTLGFRGEALAAISAVSQVQILTKPQSQAMGYSYTIENSQPGQAGDAGCPDGTTMVVRNVFSNVPARYKYLKTDAAEGSAIHAVLEREALAHPEIAFRFIRDGKSVFTSAGDGALLHVIDAILPGEGPHLLEVRAQEGPIQVTGYVGKPTRCKGTRSGQFTFVNGRWIKSQLLTAAIERAYQNQHMVGRFPIAVLHITMALDRVDVNAHPAKTEVRFVEEKPLFGRVYHAVEAALLGQTDRPELHPEPVRPAASDIPAAPSKAAAPSPAPAAPAPRGHIPAPVSTGTDKDRVVFHSPAAVADVPRPRPAVWPKGEAKGGEQLKLDAPAPSTFVHAPTASYDPAPPVAEKAPAAESEAAPWRIVGEAMKTYIIVEQGDKLLFIDKHAAHERMGFDKLKAQGYRPMSQELLKPLVWRGDPQTRETLLHHAKDLESFGFQLEDFGNDALAVRAAPDFLAYEDIAATLEELAGQYALAGGADPGTQRDALMHTMACKAAIKGGQKSQPQELEVVARAVMEGKVTHCPHGRPVATELTKKQLEKQFGRS